MVRSATTGAEACADFAALRGAEAPLFHGATRVALSKHLASVLIIQLQPAMEGGVLLSAWEFAHHGQWLLRSVRRTCGADPVSGTGRSQSREPRDDWLSRRADDVSLPV